jgi:hypothetical protein
MAGAELDRPVEAWFEGRMARSREPKDRIRRAIQSPPPPPGPQDRLIGLGGEPLAGEDGLMLHGLDGSAEIRGEPEQLDWLAAVLDAARPGAAALTLETAVSSFPGEWRRWSRTWDQVREVGLVIV